MKKVCILGSSSYVAKGLIRNFERNKNYDLTLLSRIHNNLNGIDNKYDVIINCIYDHSNPFFISEKYDNIIIENLIRYPDTLYIFFSSGAVYGKGFKNIKNPFTTIDMNNIQSEDYYYINKIYTEAKHRSLSDLNIVDIRLFGYFSRDIDLNSHYLLANIINSIKNNTVLKTDHENIFRDYIHPDDLFALLECCIKQEKINTYYDSYSSNFISKADLFDIFTEKYNLKYEFTANLETVDTTGFKKFYFSTNKKAGDIGYIPKFSSERTILEEMSFIS